MNNLIIALALCGLAGALTYGFPAYLKNISKKPPESFAGLTLLFSLFVGGLCAALFTQAIGYHWPWTVKPEPWPLAMVIGLGSNPLVPVVIKRLDQFVSTFGGR